MDTVTDGDRLTDSYLPLLTDLGSHIESIPCENTVASFQRARELVAFKAGQLQIDQGLLSLLCGTTTTTTTTTTIASVRYTFV